MTCIIGTESYLFAVDENEWGQYPGASGSGGAGTNYLVPVLSYGVALQPLTRMPQPYAGLHQRKRGPQRYGYNIGGQIVMPLFGYKPAGISVSLAEKMLAWGFGAGELEAEEPASKSFEWAEGPNVANKRHTGLRVNTATLTGQADSGDIQLSLDVIGKEEFSLATATSLPNDMEKLVDMQFTDCTFAVAGSTVSASGFTQTLNRNLQSLRLNAPTITALCAGVRDETMQFIIQKENKTWDDYLRRTGSDADVEVTGEFTIQGLHNGTGGSGNYTKLTRAFNRLRFIGADQSGDFGIQMQALNFQVLKPDSASASYSDTWSEV